jgi:hypothetical protein
LNLIKQNAPGITHLFTASPQPDAIFLYVYQYGDVTCMAMENLYFVLEKLSHLLEDFRFFIFSTGDGDDRWIDEYRNDEGKLTCDRRTSPQEILYGSILTYIELLKGNPKDNELKRFLTWQIYDFFNFQLDPWNRRQAEKKLAAERKFFHKLNDIHFVESHLPAFAAFYERYIPAAISAKKIILGDIESWYKENDF